MMKKLINVTYWMVNNAASHRHRTNPCRKSPGASIHAAMETNSQFIREFLNIILRFRVRIIR
jgi:hypothetical protein